MRNWMATSDEWLSPQAAVLSPEATIRIAGAIVAADTPYHRVIAAGQRRGRSAEGWRCTAKTPHLPQRAAVAYAD